MLRLIHVYNAIWNNKVIFRNTEQLSLDIFSSFCYQLFSKIFIASRNWHDGNWAEDKNKKKNLDFKVLVYKVTPY